MSFTGIPPAAFDFYRRLHTDNTKSFWTENTAVYDETVRGPLIALAADLEKEFGEAKMFRPYRDVRFSADKSPYKTHQGCFCAFDEAVGWYVQVDAEGVMVAGGFYAGDKERTARYRAAVDAQQSGAALEKLLAKLSRAGFTIGGDQVTTRPRGCPPDHPRLALMRHSTLTASRRHEEEEVATASGLDLIRKDWRALRPLNDWILDHVVSP